MVHNNYLKSLKSQGSLTKTMSDELNSHIEKIASMLEDDKVSLDEQNPHKLQKYVSYAEKNFNMNQFDSIQLVNEAFLYLKLKNANDYDPLQEADKFGAGFS